MDRGFRGFKFRLVDWEKGRLKQVAPYSRVTPSVLNLFPRVLALMKSPREDVTGGDLVVLLNRCCLEQHNDMQE